MTIYWDIVDLGGTKNSLSEKNGICDILVKIIERLMTLSAFDRFDNIQVTSGYKEEENTNR